MQYLFDLYQSLVKYNKQNIQYNVIVIIVRGNKLNIHHY